MSKRHTYIGSVSTDTTQHIVRKPTGELTIVKRNADANYIDYRVGNLTVAFSRHNPDAVLIQCQGFTPMGDVTERLRLATFLHHHLESTK
jgi:hypothetical protein